jgi:hypothetical protein
VGLAACGGDDDDAEDLDEALTAECPAAGETLPDDFTGCLTDDTFNVAVTLEYDDCAVVRWEADGNAFWSFSGGIVTEGDPPVGPNRARVAPGASGTPRASTAGTASDDSSPHAAAVVCDDEPQRMDQGAEAMTAESWECTSGGEQARIDVYESDDQMMEALRLLSEFYDSSGDQRSLDELPSVCGDLFSVGLDSNDSATSSSMRWWRRVSTRPPARRELGVQVRTLAMAFRRSTARGPRLSAAGLGARFVALVLRCSL